MRPGAVRAPTTEFTTRDAAHLIGLTPRQVRTIARSGVLSPGRGPRNTYRFGFRDIVLLRTAAGLLAARIPPTRVIRALLRLRDQLPRGRELTEVRIAAEGDEIVVHDGGPPWNPVSGQFVFDFAVAELAAQVASLAERRHAGPEPTAVSLVARGAELEGESPEEAEAAYRRALELAPEHPDAHVNLGRLLHEAGRPEEAALHYRRALASSTRHATAWFNLGVALEDLRRPAEARKAYEQAVAVQPELADAHYNLANVCERAGDRRAALRHLPRDRALAERGSGGVR